MNDVQKPRRIGYVACYAMWLVVVGLCYAAFVIWQRTVLLVVGLIVGDSEALPFAYGAVVLLIGLGAFAVVIRSEAYLRDGVKRGQVGRRFARTVVPLVGVSGVGFLVQQVAVLMVSSP
jgi:hypothetical protein